MSNKSLASSIGADYEIEIDGVTYLISPIKVSDYAAAEQHLKSKLPDLVKAAVNATRDESPQVQEIAIKAALAETRNQFVRPEDIDAWSQTLEGVSFLFWIKIEQRYPGSVTREAVTTHVANLSEDQLANLLRRRDAASGNDALGNSDGPVTTGQTAKQSTGDGSSPHSVGTPGTAG